MQPHGLSPARPLHPSDEDTSTDHEKTPLKTRSPEPDARDEATRPEDRLGHPAQQARGWLFWAASQATDAQTPCLSDQAWGGGSRLPLAAAPARPVRSSREGSEVVQRSLRRPEVPRAPPATGLHLWVLTPTLCAPKLVSPRCCATCKERPHLAPGLPCSELL